MDETQSGSYSQPEAVGEWATGLDKTANRMELARTAQPGQILLRSTGAEGIVLPTTPNQVLALADGIREGRFDHVIKQ